MSNMPLPFQNAQEIKNCAKHFSVNTNDSKFDDVRQIILDAAKEREVYFITNNPINDNNYIQGGASHTVIGMEYGDWKYGSQLSISFNGIRYRKKENGIWSDWQYIEKNGNVASIVTNFNNLTTNGTYSYGGQDITNKPARFWVN